MKRHENAQGIMEGARNVRAIARSLSEAAEEASGEGVGAEQDAAVRLIAYRLARLCKVDEISYGYDTETLNDTYCTLIKECRVRAVEDTIATVRMVDPVLSHPDLGAPAEQKGFGLQEGEPDPAGTALNPEIRRGGWRSLKERFFSVRPD